MALRTFLPAKLTRPHAAGLIARERLFARLDGEQPTCCIWISAPAGAGKTSLVTSWIEARRLPCTWYQVDGGDADPATLFHYLKLAAKATAGRRRIELPHLTPEFLPGLDVFVRRFFEAYFALFPESHALVFDNYQDVAAESLFHTLVHGALHALPEGARIVCVSREPPPALLARWSAEAAFVSLGWDELRLTDAEAQALANLGEARDSADVIALNGLARGWAAGLKLLLRARSAAIEVAAATARAPEVLFDYLAAEVFERSRPALREFLVRSAFLPKMSAAAARCLTGHDDAAEMLDWLERHRLFTERRPQASGTYYEYHPLFRGFLLQLANVQFAPEEIAALRRRAAAVLEEEGQLDMAVAELVATQDWPGLSRIACAHGPELVAQGRTSTLEQWIALLPQTVVEANAWLLLWLGVCRTFRDPEAGRSTLEQAYRGFRAAGDTSGAFMALGNLVGSMLLAWTNAAAVEPWIKEFEAVIEANGGVIPAPVEAQVLGACQGILLMRPGHPVLQGLVNRALSVAPTLSDASQRLSVGTLCTNYLLWRGDVVEARRFCDELRAGTTGRAAPWQQILFDLHHAMILWVDADHEAARTVLRDAIEHAHATGLAIANPLLYTQMAFMELSAGDLAAAHAALDIGWPDPAPWNALELQGYRLLRVAAFLLGGRTAEATALVKVVQDNWHDQGPPWGTAFMRGALAFELLLLGDHGKARGELSTVLAFARQVPSTLLQFLALIPLAWSHFEYGENEAGFASLREALEIGRRHDYKNCHPLWVPHIMSDVLARALEERIEPDYARRLIRLRGLTPPKNRPDLDAWPWPVRIYTLGRFVVLLADEPLRLFAKTPKKPLELLKAAVALGSRGVALTTLAQNLWPDLDGDAAQNALTVALHRLRKLLGDEQALSLHEGALTLDTQRVWVDAWALQRLAAQVDGSASAQETPSAAARASLAANLLRLYLGHFLGDEEAPWALGFRERLRSRFLRACLLLGSRSEAAARRDEAIDLYRRVIELDPLAEEFHLGLMRNLTALDRVAEALDAYRRCRDIFSITLGVEPSAKTQAFYRTLMG